MSIEEALKKCFKTIEPKKMTNTAIVSCIWDMDGQWVDMNYSYDPYLGYGECVLCYAELYSDGEPNERTWEEAKQIAEGLAQKYAVKVLYDTYDT